jgi:hypothetical protein
MAKRKKRNQRIDDAKALRRADRERARAMGILGTPKWRMSGQTFGARRPERDWKADVRTDLQD